MVADEIDALFSTLPAAFVQTRNALVKSLKAAGRREEAARAAALSRPSPAVWAVNQIARRAPEMVARLGELTAQLQRAAGAGGYGGLVNEHRDLLKTLREKGAEILEGAALRASPEVLAAVVQNLRAGMADEATRPLLERGRLEREVASDALASGFVAPPDSDLPAAKPVVAAPPSPKPQPDRDAAERERAAAAATRARSAARTEAQKRIDHLRAALGAAQRRQSSEERSNAEAQAALAESERSLEAAREAARQAAADLARAEADLAALAP
jgi:hypothetical protein